MITNQHPTTRLAPPAPASAVDEACRALWGRLQALRDEHGPPRLVGVTSGVRGEGVSTLAAGLARAAVEVSGEAAVLLVDAHGRHPALHRRFETGLTPGLGEVLSGQCDLDAAVRRIPPTGLTLLTAGETAAEGVPLATLAEGCEPLIDEIVARYDLAIFDLPPTGPELLSLPLTRLLDGVVLVVEAERERWQAVQQTAQVLAQARVHVFGVALNKRPNHIPGWLYRKL